MNSEVFFLEYCFDEEIDTDDLTREFSEKEGSIPDFYFHDFNGNERIIEVKISDTAQYFKQYEKDFPGAKFSFIANYEHEDVPGWKIRIWKGFCKELKKSPLTESDFLVEGYLEFLRRIIKMPDFKGVNNTWGTKNLSTFYDNLENIFVGDYGFSEYTQGEYHTKGYYGRVFKKKGLLIWIGIYYKNEKIFVAFKDDERWTPKGILGKLKDLYEEGLCENRAVKELRFNYWFHMGDCKTLCNKDDDDAKQNEALKESIERVFSDIGASNYLR